MAFLRYDTPRGRRNGHHPILVPHPARPGGRSSSQAWLGQHATVELRHGYTVGKVAELARTALAGKLTPGVDPDDAYQTAWSLIAERVCAAAERPAPGRLVWDAREALSRLVDDERRHRGQPYRQNRNRTNFHRYWDWQSRHEPSPEAIVVDQTAVTQILPQLSQGERAVLAALADTGDHAAAAARLGLTLGAYKTLLAKARRRFLALWHEGEAPSRLWRLDVREHGWRRRAALGHRYETCGCAGCGSRRIAAARATVQELPAAVGA